MTELAMLEQRRALVTLSADLQRATLARRLAHVQARPARAALDVAISVAGRPAARRALIAAALFTWRALRKRRA